MLRNTLLIFSSSLLLIACGQARSDDAAAPETPSVPSPEELLVESVEDTSIAIPGLPDVVAKLDDIEIRGEELSQMIEPMLRRYRAMGVPASLIASQIGSLREEALDHLILQRLLMRQADAAGITVADEDVDAFIKENLPQGLTLDVVAEQRGVSVADIRKEIGEGLRVDKFAKTLLTDFEPSTDEAVHAEYETLRAEHPEEFTTEESVHASHILVLVNKDSTDEEKDAARKKIEDIRQKLLDGADFATLAREQSDCPSGRNGGDLGTFGRGRMVKPFEDAAFSQAVGEIGPVVETSFGFHIIRVEEHIDAGEKTFDDVKDDIRDYLDDQRREKIFTDYLDALREKTAIETFLPKIEVSVEDTEDSKTTDGKPVPDWAK